MKALLLLLFVCGAAASGNWRSGRGSSDRETGGTGRQEWYRQDRQEWYQRERQEWYKPDGQEWYPQKLREKRQQPTYASPSVYQYTQHATDPSEEEKALVERLIHVLRSEQYQRER